VSRGLILDFLKLNDDVSSECPKDDDEIADIKENILELLYFCWTDLYPNKPFFFD
jgi:hypothetical protein